MKTKRSTYGAIAVTAATIFLTIAGLAPELASAQAIYGQTCRLGVFPYYVEALSDTLGSAADPYINFLSASQCTSHVPVPGAKGVNDAYHPQPPTDADNPLKAGSETIRAPISRHYHAYFNDSPSQANYYTKSFVDQFEITIESDGWDNIYLDQITCWTPVPNGYDGNLDSPDDPDNESEVSEIQDCSGTAENLWGGTTVSKNYNAGTKELTINWKFANSLKGRPTIYGNNGSSFTTYKDNNNNGVVDAGEINQTLNLTDPYNRKLEFSVNLPTKNVNSPTNVWSTTTTSRALIRELALKKTNYPANFYKGCANSDVNNASSGWCYQPVPGGFETAAVTSTSGTYTYFWYPIGSVSNTWKKPVPQQKVCSNLALDILQNGQHYNPANVTGLQSNTPMTLTVTPSFTGTGATPDLSYNWKTTPLNGLFKDSEASPAPGQNPFTDGDEGSYYTGGTPLTKVEVTAVDNGALQNQCHAEFIIPQTPTKACIDLDIFRNGAEVPATLPVGSPTDNLYVGNLQTSPPGLDLDFTWSKTGAGTLNPMQTTNPSDQVDLTGGQNGTTVTVTAHEPATPNTPVNGCTDTFTLTDLGQECLTIGAVTSTDPLHEGETTFITVNPQYSGGLTTQSITWSEQGAGSFVKAGFLPAFCPAVINGSATVEKECFAYTYFAGNAGDTYSVSILPDPTNNSACEFSRPVLPPAPPVVACDYIEPIQPSDWELNANGDTNLRVKVHFDDGNSYNTHVLWTGSNGNYNGNPSSNQTHSSASNFNETFTSTSDNSSANVRVTEFWDAGNVQHDVTTGDCATGLTIETPEYRCEYVTPNYSNGQVCLQTNPEYTGGFTWEYDNQTVTTDSPNCEDVPPDTDYQIFATTEPNNTACQLEDRTPERPPELEKRISLNGTDYRTGTVTVQATQDKVYYQLTFKPNSPKTSATIKDTISIAGYLLAELLPANAENAPAPGRIVYSDEMKVFEQGYGELQNCSDIDFGTEDPSHCYSGDIGQSFGVRLIRVDGNVTITYTGRVESALEDPDVCKTSDVCQEKYRNRATADNIVVYVDEENSIQYPPIFSEEIVVQIFCQYILTRAAGDIFLETDLNAGVDILMCSRYRSSTGIIVTPGQPDTPEIVSTGAGDTEIFTIGHEICTQGQAGTISGELSTLYGQSVVENLSSQICEVRLRTGSPWKQKVITNSVDENKTRISRWEPTVEGIGSSLGALVNQYPDEQVYHVKGGDLTVDQDFTLSDGEYPGQGAKTFIVEDGNLIINSNILYGTCNKTDGTQCNARDIASLAFIVINGNIYIDKNVEQLAGVFYVQEGESGTGKLYSGTKSAGTYTTSDLSTRKLTVNGSVYGDIDPLFTYRVYAGDPALEQGGIVIRFDERVILNTPPGLRDVLNLSQTEVAR